MQVIKIDNKVPLPTARNGRGAFADALRALKVGDSFLVPEQYASTARQVANIYQKKIGAKFSIRKTPEGLRLWRVG